MQQNATGESQFGYEAQDTGRTLEFCFYPMPNYIAMACFFILQCFLLTYSILKNAAVRKLVTQKNSLQPMLLIYIGIFVLKTIFFIIVGIYTIESENRDSNLMILTR